MFRALTHAALLKVFLRIAIGTRTSQSIKFDVKTEHKTEDQI